MAAPAALTPQQLIAKNEAPVKAQYLRPAVRSLGQRDRSALTPEQGNVQPTSASVALGEAAASVQPGASIAAAEPGVTGTHDSAVAQEKGGNKRNGAKSNGGWQQRTKQAKKKMQKPVELCYLFLKHACTWGDKCRFSHDVAAYVAAKPPDLPGRCPFSSLSVCPHGITCRWASAHTYSDPLQDQLRDLVAATPAASSTAATLAAGPTTHPPTAANNTAADLNPTVNGTAAAVATEDIAAFPAASTAQVAPVGMDGTAVNGSAPPAGAVAGVVAAAAAGPVGDGSVPAGTVELPVASVIQEGVNVLSKEVQSLLRSNRYNYSKADAVLQELGLKLTFRPSKPLQGDNKRPATTATTPAAAATAASDTKAAAHSAAALAAGVVEPSASNGAAVSPVSDVPAAKRARTDDSVPAIQSTDNAGAAAPQHAAPMVVDAPQPLANSDAALIAGLAVAVPTANGLAVAHTDAPAADGSAAAHTDAPAATGTAATAADATGQAAAAVGAGAGGLIAAEARVEARQSYQEVPLRAAEVKRLDLRGKTYLAPLTTTGNLPFRRLCKQLGADVTCGEMAMATCLMQGASPEWALLRRHPSEDLFGVQICGGYSDALARAAQLLSENVSVDFVDVNMGCPIDMICEKGAGSHLLTRPRRIQDITRAMSRSLGVPLTLKMRKGYNDGNDIAHTLLPNVLEWGAQAVTLHGRTRQQRYSKLADWGYIHKCAEAAPDLQLIGNGDIFSYEDWNAHVGPESPLASCMIARGALIKPWIFTEIKEQRHWDISASERLDLLKSYVSAGLEHWGSDSRGVETTRKFLLEWLSFTYRYVPVGLLEVVPQQLRWRPPSYFGRSDLETLLASENAADWVKISEMLLGPVPASFVFQPKHKSNAYAASSALDTDAATGGVAAGTGGEVAALGGKSKGDSEADMAFEG